MTYAEKKRQIQKQNRPKKGSRIKVEPIRELKAISNIKKLLANKPQDLCLFILGINLNLRASDLLSLKVSQVRNGSDFEIRERKTKKTRRIILNNACQKAIADLLGSKTYEEPDDFLFKGQRGCWSVPYVNSKVKSWCKDLNLRGNYGSHTLRKTWAYHQRITFKVELPVLMKCLNHASQKQTLDYICVQEQEISDVFQNEL